MSDTDVVVYLKAKLLAANLPPRAGVMVSVERAHHMFIATQGADVASGQSIDEALKKLADEIGTADQQAERLRKQADELIARAMQLEGAA